MAKYKLQEMPDVHNTGKRKVYPKMVTNRTLSRKEFNRTGRKLSVFLANPNSFSVRIA